MIAIYHNNISSGDPRAQWRSRANRRIEFTPGNPADRATVLKRNEYVTAAYAEMYLRNPAVYKWAGMAALTSAAVGRGMYMIHYLKQSRMGLMLGLFGREVAAVADLLGAGNLAVFEDIYWQHLAYERAGIAELERLVHAGALDGRVMQAWQQIDHARCVVPRARGSRQWVSPRGSSRSCARNTRPVRSLSVSATGTRSTCRIPRKGYAIRPRAAWTAASRSVTPGVRSET